VAPNSPDLSPLDYQAGLLAIMEFYHHKLQPKRKSVPEVKDALQLIWSALPEKAIDNTVKDYRKRLRACV